MLKAVSCCWEREGGRLKRNKKVKKKKEGLQRAMVAIKVGLVNFGVMNEMQTFVVGLVKLEWMGYN